MQRASKKTKLNLFYTVYSKCAPNMCFLNAYALLRNLFKAKEEVKRLWRFIAV